MQRWRLAFFAIFLFCAGSIAFALYHQYYNWLMPCLMCVYERMAVIAVGLFALLAALRPPKTRIGVIIQADLVATTAIIGAVVAIRHVLMQYGPPDPVASCAASLPFPINLDDPFWPAWLGALIRPVGDCSVIDFAVFGVSMPVWLIVSFLGLASAALLLGFWRWRELPVNGATKGEQA